MPAGEPDETAYRSTLSAEDIERIRVRHDRAYAEELQAGSVVRTFHDLGASITVPPGVMPITPMSTCLASRSCSHLRR